ncbi:MAG: sigma-70 family RNA polymerase sigma factor [Bacteroidetes bacterium]|nr:MAG: sigma-70 family RNA polymerase sigma factor [Bacteroidota bacterium]
MDDFKIYKDEELVPLFRKQNESSDNVFFELFQRHSKKLNAYCMIRVYDPETVRDIIQDTWFEFVSAAKEGKDISNVQKYLIGIARNLINKYIKIQKQRSELFINESGIHLDGLKINLNLQLSIETNEFISIVKIVSSMLDEPFREIYLLRKINDLTYTDIAAITGKTLQEVKRIYWKASLTMNDLLKPYFEEKESERI